MRCGHRGAYGKEVTIAGSQLSARAQHKVKYEAVGKNGTDNAELRRRGEQSVAARRRHVHNRLPKVAVRSQPVKHGGRIEPQPSETNRTGGGEGHTVAPLPGNREKPAIEVSAGVSSCAHPQGAAGRGRVGPGGWG